MSYLYQKNNLLYFLTLLFGVISFILADSKASAFSEKHPMIEEEKMTLKVIQYRNLVLNHNNLLALNKSLQFKVYIPDKKENSDPVPTLEAWEFEAENRPEQLDSQNTFRSRNYSM